MRLPRTYLNPKWCRLICQYNGIKANNNVGELYKSGYAYCARCAFYFLNKIRCPCCNLQLRFHPAKNKHINEYSRY